MENGLGYCADGVRIGMRGGWIGSEDGESWIGMVDLEKGECECQVEPVT